MYEQRQQYGYQEELLWKYYYFNITHIQIRRRGTFLYGLFDLSSIIDPTIYFRLASKWLSHLSTLKQHDIMGKQTDLHMLLASPVEVPGKQMIPVLNRRCSIGTMIYTPIGKHGAVYASCLMFCFTNYVAEHIDSSMCYLLFSEYFYLCCILTHPWTDWFHSDAGIPVSETMFNMGSKK